MIDGSESVAQHTNADKVAVLPVQLEEAGMVLPLYRQTDSPPFREPREGRTGYMSERVEERAVGKDGHRERAVVDNGESEPGLEQGGDGGGGEETEEGEFAEEEEGEC